MFLLRAANPEGQQSLLMHGLHIRDALLPSRNIDVYHALELGFREVLVYLFEKRVDDVLVAPVYPPRRLQLLLPFSPVPLHAYQVVFLEDVQMIQHRAVAYPQLVRDFFSLYFFIFAVFQQIQDGRPVLVGT